MNRYTYEVRMTVTVMAENEYDAEDMVDRILPAQSDQVDIYRCGLDDVEEITYEEAVADCWNDERKL